MGPFTFGVRYDWVNSDWWLKSAVKIKAMKPIEVKILAQICSDMCVCGCMFCVCWKAWDQKFHI